MLFLLHFGISLAAMWHVVGFAFGLVYVRLSLLSLLGRVPYDGRWSWILRRADVHLWASGFVLIVLGALDKGGAIYFDNPKLWAKVTVIVAWFVSTQLMRRMAVPKLRQGKPEIMIQLSAINVSCWIYGAFLGCAKPLAYHVVSYPAFLLGFVAVYCLAASVIGRMRLGS